MYMKVIPNILDIFIYNYYVYVITQHRKYMHVLD